MISNLKRFEEFVHSQNFKLINLQTLEHKLSLKVLVTTLDSAAMEVALPSSLYQVDEEVVL